MTLKEEEVTRREMAKILPSIQIGHIDKNVKEYLNSTIDDVTHVEVNAIQNTYINDTTTETEKNDEESEHKLKDDDHFQTLTSPMKNDHDAERNDKKNLIENDVITKSLDLTLEDHVPSAAADNVNSFLNSLIQRADGGKNTNT